MDINNVDEKPNKGVAVLCYIGIFVIIPLLTGAHKTSEFIKFHVNQGLRLLIFSFAYSFIMGILYVVFVVFMMASMGSIDASSMAAPMVLGIYIIILILFIILFTLPLILTIVGIFSALLGRMKNLAFIGKYDIVK